MTFEIEFNVRTKVKDKRTNDLTESFTISVEANFFGEARERAFAIIKQANSLEGLMDSLIN